MAAILTISGIPKPLQGKQALLSLFGDNRVTLLKAHSGTATFLIPTLQLANSFKYSIESQTYYNRQLRCNVKPKNANSGQQPVTKPNPKSKIPTIAFEVIEAVNDHDFIFLDSKLGQELICPVCTLLLQNPHKAPCGHYFCLECITNCLKVQQLCPVCRQPSSSVSSDLLVSKMVNIIQIHCQHYSHDPDVRDLCIWTGSVENLQSHLHSDCLIQPIKCNLCSWVGNRQTAPNHLLSCPGLFEHCDNQYRGCGWRGTKADAIQHREECLYEVIFCENRNRGCPVGNRRSMYPFYHAQECGFAPCKCEKCSWSGLARDFELHTSRVCPERVVRCPMAGCSNIIKANRLSIHLGECLHRIIECGDCEWKGAFLNFERHVSVCPERIVLCKNSSLGCSVKTRRKAELYHRSLCIFQKVTCDKCSWSGCKNALRDHQTQQCPERSVGCAKCSWTGNFKTLQLHKLHCGTQTKAATLHSEECPTKTCGHCNWSGPELSMHFFGECPNRHVNCDRCSWVGVASGLANHKKVCSDSVVKCELCGTFCLEPR